MNSVDLELCYALWHIAIYVIHLRMVYCQYTTRMQSHRRYTIYIRYTAYFHLHVKFMEGVADTAFCMVN